MLFMYFGIVRSATMRTAQNSLRDRPSILLTHNAFSAGRAPEQEEARLSDDEFEAFMGDPEEAEEAAGAGAPAPGERSRSGRALDKELAALEVGS